MDKNKLNYVINGNSYAPVGSLKNVVSVLPPAVYEIRDVPFAGTQLFLRENMDISVPKKVYGKNPVNLEKAFRAFDRRPLNTGILLSGERGMGKTLFARMAIKEALNRGMAVINLTNAVDLDNAITLINKITQPLVIVMDEFEKNFSVSRNASNDDDSDSNDGTGGTQFKFLSMLDGMGSSEKRMFIATVNDTDDLNKFLLNRPGRFYYHFEFKRLSAAEMEEYLTHELKKSVPKKTIKFAVSIMQSYSINYDGIAAIADELNAGIRVEEALHDLNLDREGSTGFKLVIKINGYVYERTVNHYSIDEFRTGGYWSETLYCINPDMTGHEDKLMSRSGYPGTTVEVVFFGDKMEMQKNGSIIVPANKLKNISLTNRRMNVNGKEEYTLTANDFAKVSDLKFEMLTRNDDALYMQYLDV